MYCHPKQNIQMENDLVYVYDFQNNHGSSPLRMIMVKFSYQIEYLIYHVSKSLLWMEGIYNKTLDIEVWYSLQKYSGNIDSKESVYSLRPSDAYMGR